MQDFTVKRIKPWELPPVEILSLKYTYRIELCDFILSVDFKKRILYVKDSVPEDDIEGFLECINFPYSYVADEEIGNGKFMEYVYEKYGFSTYNILFNAHSEWRRRERKRIANEHISKFLPLIHEKTEKLDIDEALLFAAWDVGYSIDKKTPENLVNYGIEYVFSLGYLMGSGVVSNDLMGEAV